MKGPRARLNVMLAAALAALTLSVYAPVREFEFVNYDDNVYVTENARTGQGLNGDNIAWCLGAFVNGNWHPLTLFSHMLDVSLFGLDPAGHHSMNLMLHVANVIFLFWLLVATARRPWPAAFVAALFAVHPLNVQTVAWVSERKSLLSTALWLLALIAHASHRRVPSGRKYLLVIALAGLALAAKPMAVTLPLTMVLLDIWPLAQQPSGRGSVGRRYAAELAPILGMAFGCGVLTLLAQRAASAIQSVAAFPLSVRLGNAVVAYVWYLKAMIWPAGLAVFYPHPMESQALARVAGSGLVLVVICALVVVKGRAFPPLTMGWLWYVGTLLPVAGLIQVGSQAYADRYAYVPLIGIFIVVVWSGLRLTESRPEVLRRAFAVAGVCWIGVLSLVTRVQLPYWRDSVSLYKRAIDVVPDNALAQNNLGMALVEQQKFAEALGHFQRAVAIAPFDTDARSNLGNALRAVGRPAEAVETYGQALDQSPNDASIRYNLATALADLGRTDDAVSQLREAVRLEPAYTKAIFFLGVLLARQGLADDALAQFHEVQRLDPRDARVGEWITRIERERGGGDPR